MRDGASPEIGSFKLNRSPLAPFLEGRIARLFSGIHARGGKYIVILLEIHAKWASADGLLHI
jgi:hypothetical protein